MSIQLTTVPTPDAWPSDGPRHRSIVAIDVEGSTKRANPVKGELRRIMYELLEQALQTAGIGPKHLEQLADRGDGVLILIRPHDDVPKTVLFGRLIPALTALLAEHNTATARPELRLRLRTVIHAGEVHEDSRGFYGDDIDVAFRLLEAPAVKRVLRQAPGSPLVLVVSEEIFSAIVRHGYVPAAPYRQQVRVRVGEQQRRGRVHVPIPADFAWPVAVRRAHTPRPSPSPTIAQAAASGSRRPARPGSARP